MAVNLIVHDDVIDLQITGWFDKLMCMDTGERIAMADVVGARLVEWGEVRGQLGMRVGGAYFPNRIATGWYTVPGRKGARQLLAIFADRDHLLVVETRLNKPCRLVLDHPDRDRLAWWINERVTPVTEPPSAA